MSKKDNVFGDVFEQMDKTFEKMDKMFDSDFFKTTKEVVSTILSFAGPFPAFPPINVYSESLNIDPASFEVLQTPVLVYNVELALSGYKSEDVQVNVHDVAGVKVLVIESKGVNDKRRNPQTRDESVTWYQRGIAGRAFKVSFTLHSNVKVTSADLRDGLLTIKLSMDNPAKKPTVENIPVNRG